MIVELTYIRSSDTDSVGRTAARLGERLRNGVETAPGFVVTTDDLAELVEREDLASRLEGLSAEEAAALAEEVITAAQLPADLVDDLAESYAALGRDAWVSVQASPTERDLGVSRDVLGPVQGADAAWALIRQVWASLWAPEAIARRVEKTVTDAQDKLAVLVQQADAPAEPAPAADAGESTEKAEETAPELPLDEPVETPAAAEAAAPEVTAPNATAEPAGDVGAGEEDEEAVVAEAELAEDEGRAVEQAEAIADEADPVEAAEVILAEDEALRMTADEQDTQAVVTGAEADEDPVEETRSGEAQVDETRDSDAREAETAPEPAESVEPLADAEPEQAEAEQQAEPEPEPSEAAEPVLDGESESAAEPAPEILETEAFEDVTAGETPEAAEPADREEPAGTSRPRAQASGGDSSFTARTEPSGRSRWIVIGLVSFVLLLLFRRLRRR